MPAPTPVIFRAAIAATFVFHVLYFLPAAGLITFAADIEMARSWNYYGCIVPYESVDLFWKMTLFLLAVSLCGLWFFSQSARSILAIWYVTTLLAEPFLGLAVYSSYEETTGGIGNALVVWLISVSFWSPLADRFSPVNQPPVPPA